MTRTPRQLAAENARRAAAGEPPLDEPEGTPVLTSEELSRMTVAERTAYVHDRAVLAAARLPQAILDKIAAPPASPELLREALKACAEALHYHPNPGFDAHNCKACAAREQARAALAAPPDAPSLRDECGHQFGLNTCHRPQGHAGRHRVAPLPTERKARAALAAAPAGLEVERLAAACVQANGWTPPRYQLEAVAAEYARLASEEETP